MRKLCGMFWILVFAVAVSNLWAEKPVVGVVTQAQGVLHVREGSNKAVSPMDRVYTDSVFVRDPSFPGQARLQVCFSMTRFVPYSLFPTPSFAASTALSQANLMGLLGAFAALGVMGTSTKGIDDGSDAGIDAIARANEIQAWLSWAMDIGQLMYSDLAALAIRIGSRSSVETGSVHPVDFKLKPDIQLADVETEVVSTDGSRPRTFAWRNNDEEWSLDLADLSLEAGCAFTLSTKARDSKNGNIYLWRTSVTVLPLSAAADIKAQEKRLSALYPADVDQGLLHLQTLTSRGLSFSKYLMLESQGAWLGGLFPSPKGKSQL